MSQRQALVGVDLAGDEAHWPGELFVEHMRRAREAGLHITVHAGEAAGPHSVWQALGELHAERIGHAVHAVEDPALMDFLLEQQTGIESSTEQQRADQHGAGLSGASAAHFFGARVAGYHQHGRSGISAIDLRHEYDVAAPAAGLSAGLIRQAQRNALEAAFLSPAEKDALRAAGPVLLSGVLNLKDMGPAVNTGFEYPHGKRQTGQACQGLRPAFMVACQTAEASRPTHR